MTLTISRYRMTYQAITPIRLPEYAGSNLRGAFGHALKSIACLTATANRGHCACQPAESCVYRQLFDPALRIVAGAQAQHVPTPLIIEPNAGDLVIRAHEQRHFDMVVLGQFAHSQLPIIQLAWQRALHDGIGSQDEQGKRGTARLLGMQLLDQPSIEIPANPKTVHLQITSPMRLQHYGELVNATHLTASILVRAVVRRYRLMHEVYGQTHDVDLDQLQTEINQIGLQRRLRWTEWTRWSSRQKQEMQLNGLTGRVLLTDVSDALWRYLYLGQWLHAGKNSMFGLGRYQVVSEPWLEQIEPQQKTA